MMIVSTTGYIISALGPYHADVKNNDASIIKHNINFNMENMREWLQEEDVLIVDRGFRDLVEFLGEIGIESHMPAFLLKGQKQHSSEEANTSRLVTKIRWVVESVNSRIKQWKYLANIVPNTQIPYIGDYVRLICAICNKYKGPLSAGNPDDDQILAAKMKVCPEKKKNVLQERVTEEGLDRKTHAWKKLDAADAVPDFPSMSEEELRDITIGIYQLQMAKHYTQEHMTEDGRFQIVLNEDFPGILRAQVQSRHTSSKRYWLWVEYSPAVVKSWYWQCQAGARVVGTCCHIATVLWYLGYARHSVDILPSVQNWSKYLQDASEFPVLMDDSDISEEE
ncbi:uncharacterized protein [Argopecten irradians]|uniref:uncharacterized protein n=1 Tax=Argopecten irradians TaxID=31199 RepID=UPI0037112FF8